MRHLRLSALAAGLIAAAPVAAHDTWFEVEGRDAAGAHTLALGTGNQFPLQETPIGAEYLVASGCRAGDGAVLPLEPLRVGPQALLLRAPPADAGLSCWAQSQPFEITLAPAVVELYLKEIAAPPSVREAWADMRSRGIAWTERYAKHARIELPGVLPRPAADSGMAMDVRPLGEVREWQVGDSVAFEVLRDGQPLPGLAVEFRHERAPLGLWRRSDAQGRVDLRLPLPGRWVLRGTELRAVPGRPGHWDSRFVTLAFEVAARETPDTQKGMNARPNARSTNHSAASSAIASEPPISTTRW
jgi:hypothetical protein